MHVTTTRGQLLPEGEQAGMDPLSQPPSSPPEPHLQAGALKLPSVMMQGITHIAPAAGVILTLQSTTKLAGVTAPLAYAIAFVIALTIGLSLAELAKYLPSAGGYYTYVSRTVHPRAGFLTAWLYFLYDPVGAAMNLAFMGHFIENSLPDAYRHWFPWWAFLVIATLMITFLAYRGIKISSEIMVMLGIAEIVLVVALTVAGLVRPGEGGVNFHSFLPSNAPSIGGVYLAVIFSIFCFTGFESVAPLAEESANPRRNLPRAIVGALLFMGAFNIFCSWGLLVGWGTNALPSLVSLPESGENPLFLLARRLWGGGWILILLALLNSVLGVSIAATNAATRVFFAMGRGGVLPHALAKIHPVHHTPTNAIALQTLLTLALGLGLGFWFGPDQEFYFLAVAMTLGMVFVYGAGNLGVFLFFRREHRSQFRYWTHAFMPLLSSVALLWVGYKSIYPAPDPMPEPPVKYAPYLVGAWLGLGIFILWAMKRAGRESWLLKAGQTVYEQADQ